MALDEYSVVAVALSKVDDKLEKLQDEVFSMSKVLAKQDVLLEKIVNLEINSNENNKRVHHKVDEIKKKIDRVNEAHNSGGCSVFREYIAHNEGINIDDRIKTLENKGSKRWEVAVNKLIEWAILFVIGAVLLKFGVSTK